MNMFKVLLALYPKSFREHFGSQLEEAYQDRAHSWSVISLMLDMLTGAFQAHWQASALPQTVLAGSNFTPNWQQITRAYGTATLSTASLTSIALAANFWLGLVLFDPKMWGGWVAIFSSIFVLVCALMFWGKSFEKHDKMASLHKHLHPITSMCGLASTLVIVTLLFMCAHQLDHNDILWDGGQTLVARSLGMSFIFQSHLLDSNGWEGMSLLISVLLCVANTIPFAPIPNSKPQHSKRLNNVAIFMHGALFLASLSWLVFVWHKTPHISPSTVWAVANMLVAIFFLIQKLKRVKYPTSVHFFFFWLGPCMSIFYAAMWVGLNVSWAHPHPALTKFGTDQLASLETLKKDHQVHEFWQRNAILGRHTNDALSDQPWFLWGLVHEGKAGVTADLWCMAVRKSSTFKCADLPEPSQWISSEAQAQQLSLYVHIQKEKANLQ